MKAVTCPVCGGSGKYKKKVCHGCFGKGWVEVAVSYPPRKLKPWEVDFRRDDYEIGSTTTKYDAGPYWGIGNL